MKSPFRNWTSLLFAALLMAGLNACSKSELVEPTCSHAPEAVTKGTSSPETGVEGGISDDGDDEGDSERNNRRKPKAP